MPDKTSVGFQSVTVELTRKQLARLVEGRTVTKLGSNGITVTVKNTKKKGSRR
jgi:hypothetical protein